MAVRRGYSLLCNQTRLQSVVGGFSHSSWFSTSCFEKPTLLCSPNKRNSHLQQQCNHRDSYLEVQRQALCTTGNSLNYQSVDKHCSTSDADVLDMLKGDMQIIPNFISEDEEGQIMKEMQPYLQRMKYEFDHWDDAIHGFRETEKKKWQEKNKHVIGRVQKIAFTDADAPLAYVHVLDLAADGFIKPHVDAVKFCGSCVAGICLLSSAVMRLRLDADRDRYADFLVPRFSLYIMKDRARYDFAHEILKDSESFFKGEHILRERRISVICRNEPT